MKTAHYTRSDVYSYFDLSEAQQSEHAELQDSFFVDDPCSPGESLPLCNFVRTNGGRFDGTYGMSYFSAYGVKLSACGTQAVVAYIHW
jgi:hypothetical protein